MTTVKTVVWCGVQGDGSYSREGCIHGRRARCKAAPNAPKAGKWSLGVIERAQATAMALSSVVVHAWGPRWMRLMEHGRMCAGGEVAKGGRLGLPVQIRSGAMYGRQSARRMVESGSTRRGRVLRTGIRCGQTRWDGVRSRESQA